MSWLKDPSDTKKLTKGGGGLRANLHDMGDDRNLAVEPFETKQPRQPPIQTAPRI